MRNKRLLLVTLSIVCCLCLILAACTFFTITDLSTPVVEIDGNGLASWTAVKNASGYKYKIDGGEEVATDKLSVQLSSGQSIVVKAVGDGTQYKDSAYSASKTYTKFAPTPLNAPVVSISKSGMASWSAVTNATGYKYKIDDGAEVSTTNLSVKLTDGQSISVKAVGNGTTYSDSAYSAVSTYTAPPVPDTPTQLDAPTVTISTSGIASWTANSNAESYKYKIDGGAEVSVNALSVQLSDGQSIVVKACGDGVYYSDSDFSASQTYVAPKVLTVPTVTIAQDGTASWEAVANAVSYKYKINGGVEHSTDVTSVKLTHRDTIQVKAVGNGTTYLDSAFSSLQTYLDPNVPTDCTHVDSNNDTICDICKESVIAQLSFLSINDLHGKFMDTSTQPGVDELTTYLKNLYADPAREEILLSTGDMWQGTAESSLTKGKLMTTWMNEVGFSAMALGNHEFDWGVNSIKESAQIANFPILGINVTVNGSQPEYIKNSVIVEKGGVKIGVIGAIGNCLGSIASEMRSGVSFATGNVLTNLVKNESDRLRDQENCDMIIYLIHDGRGQSYNTIQDFTASDFHSGSDTEAGYIYYDTSLSNGYVDLVFESHTHQNYILRDEYGVYHLQGASENRYLNLAEVSYNTVTNEIVTVTPNKVPASTYAASNINSDPVVQEIYNQYFPDRDLYAIIGTNNSQRNSTTIKNKVAELYYQFGQKTWGDKNVVLGGGFLNVRNPYYLYAGNVTYADIFALLPFDNDLVLGKISGSNLKSKFINNTKYACYYEIDASSISDTATYYIVVDTYTSTWNGNGITEVERISSTYARDLLAEFVANGGWGTGTSTGGGTGGSTGGGTTGGDSTTPTTVSVTQALDIGEKLANNQTASGTYKITGTITSFATGSNATKYGNFYISDGTNTICVYGLYSADGNTRYDAMTNPPTEGDTITITGTITKYYNATSGYTTIEITDARLQSVS